VRAGDRFRQAHKSPILPRMPKRKEPELSPEEQYKRFKEAAKKAGVTDKEEEFERAFKKLAVKKPRTTSDPR
jgi:hypothetical protein